MYCSGCGKDNPDAVKFCRACGIALQFRTSDHSGQGGTGGATNIRGRRVRVSVAVLLFLGLIGYSGYVWYVDKEEQLGRAEREREEIVKKKEQEIQQLKDQQAAQQRQAAMQRETQKPGRVFRDCDGCPEMVVVPAGNFLMGSPPSEEGRFEIEGPQHRVTISRPFAAGRYEVTFDEWDICVRENGCSYNPSDVRWGRGRRPVINVSWQDAKQFAEWLSRKTGKRYRLLTEAEWEYVARAGTTTPYSTGATISTSQANIAQSRGRTVPVGSYGSNAFGLFDVHGNVWEWTEDCSNESYNGAPNDGSARLSGDCSQRVFRGGSWIDAPRSIRSALRSRNTTDFRYNSHGFRLARTLE